MSVRELTDVLADDYCVLVLSSRLADHFADDRGRVGTATPADGVSYQRATLGKVVRSLVEADLVLAHWTFSFRRLATLCVVLGPLLGRPTVCVIHTAPDHCKYNWLRHLPACARKALLHLIGRAMRRCAAVVALGPSQFADLLAVGLPITHIMPLMVSAHQVAATGGPWPCPPSPVPTIGIVGELSRLKGSERIPALLDYLTPQFAVSIAGTGPLTGWLRRRIGELRTEQRARVTMLGWIEPADMPEFYRSIDYLLVLSRTEAQPRVLVEAMLAGVIVIAYRATGVVDLVTDRVTGVLLDAHDPQACQRRLAELVNDPLLAAMIRGNAASSIAQRLRGRDQDWRRLLAEVLDRSRRDVEAATPTAG